MKRNKLIDVFKHVRMGAPDECWPWEASRSNKGVPYFQVDGRKRVAYAVVFELVHGPLLPGEVVRHTCDRGSGRTEFSCCNPKHLERGTHSQNMEDMKRKHRHGMSHYVVRAIRKLASDGITPAEIAKRYGIGESTVRDIVSEKTHKEADSTAIDT